MIELAGRCTAHEGGDKVLKRDAAPNPESYILAVKSFALLRFSGFRAAGGKLKPRTCGNRLVFPRKLGQLQNER